MPRSSRCRMFVHRLNIASVLAIAVAVPALAQDAPADWDLIVQPENRLTAAHTVYDNGILLATRCHRGVFQMMIGGLPEAPPAHDLQSAQRTLGIGIGDKPITDHRFMIGQNRQTAFAQLPASLARKMREGGPMQIVVAGAGEEGRNLRYVLDLPPSNTAIDQTLADCRRPLVDPRDAELEALDDDGLPRNIQWSRAPVPDYPQGRTYTAGFAVVTCLARPDGRITDCVVETEFPADGGFGAAALRGARRGRLENMDGGPVPLTRVSYRTNFDMGFSSDERTGTRFRDKPR